MSGDFRRDISSITCPRTRRALGQVSCAFAWTVHPPPQAVCSGQLQVPTIAWGPFAQTVYVPQLQSLIGPYLSRHGYVTCRHTLVAHAARTSNEEVDRSFARNALPAGHDYDSTKHCSAQLSLTAFSLVDPRMSIFAIFRHWASARNLD